MISVLLSGHPVVFFELGQGMLTGQMTPSDPEIPGLSRELGYVSPELQKDSTQNKISPSQPRMLNPCRKFRTAENLFGQEADESRAAATLSEKAEVIGFLREPSLSPRKVVSY